MTAATMRPDPNLVELPGSERIAPVGAQLRGPTDPAEVVEVTLVLRRDTRRHPLPTLEEIGRRPRAARTYLSREDFATTYGAREDDLAALRSFAGAHALRVVREERAMRLVRIAGTVGTFASLFGVRVDRYDAPGGSFRARSGVIRIPPALRHRVVGVFGLDNRPQARPHVRPRPGYAAGAPSYTPLQVGTAYAFPTDANGQGECIGIIELGGGYSPSDLAQYFQGLGVPAPSVTSVSVDGATNAPTGDPNGPDAEVELDIEVAGALAPGAQIVVYFAPNTDQGFLDAVSTAVHDTTNHPNILSISWGGPEGTWTAQARAAFESAFEDAAALGITVLVAAGDNGADDGGAGTGLSVDFPASSPAVIACGGTHLAISGTAIASETVWNDLSNGEGATGGGVSVDFAVPSYQAGANVPAAPNGFAGRGVPDVAGDADPATGYQVRVDGAPTVLGGTSAVAPLWAALIARLNQLLGKPVGFVNAELYAAPTTAAFHEITSGGNGGYTAGPGWNACTGLGSPDGAALLTALKGA
ncbi:MAG: S53 family peptidase [Thermoplasmata archaeon]